MLSLITVNWNSHDFLNLLMESIEMFTEVPYELIVIDNSDNEIKIEREHVKQFYMGQNIGHGAGLNLGLQKATQNYIMFLDCDTHFLKRYWEEPFLVSGCDVVVAKGVPAKPIRPACLFMKRTMALRYDWRASEGYRGHRITPEGTDVAIAAYHQMVSDTLSIKFLNSFPSRYETATGEEWGFEEPLIYHHWHGASIHLPCRQADFPDLDLTDEKAKLFSRILWRIP